MRLTEPGLKRDKQTWNCQETQDTHDSHDPPTG